MQQTDYYWMGEALKLAAKAVIANEVPVGAIVVHDGKLIGSGFNSSIKDHDPTAHAEILALRQAANNLKNYRILNATLYVTLEPCAMCIGAMLHARIKRLVFGAPDAKTGAVGSKINLLSYQWNHNIEYYGGVMAEESAAILSNFFKARR